MAWAGALLMVIIIGLAAGFLVREKSAQEWSEVQSAQLYARVLQDQGDRTFNTIDIVMAALADNVGSALRLNDASRSNADLSQAVDGLSFARSFSLMTASGRVIASSSPANIGVDVDMAVIKLPPDGAVDALGSSVPGRDLVDVKRSASVREPTARSFIPLLRRVGNFNGEAVYVVAVLNPDFFGNEYERLLADETRSAGLFSIDGVMLAGTGNLRKTPGQRAADHVFFTKFLPSRESGSQVGAGIDGDKVVTAFRVLRKRPLVVIVERGDTQLLSGFRKTLFGTVGICVSAVLVISAAMVLGWRRLRSHEAVRIALEATRADIAASERDFRVLVESVHELIFRADRDGRIDFVNGRWLELTQRPAADVLGKRLTDVCRGDERATCAALFARRDIESEALLVHVGHASGAWLTLDLSVSRVLDACGRTTGFAGFAIDVSAREAAKRALEAQLKFNAQLLEVSPTPIFVKNPQGRFVSVNRAWLELMGLPLSDVLGRNSADLYGLDAARHMAQDERLLASEERLSYENRLVVGGRAPRDTVVTKVRFTRGDGTPAGIVGSIIDVTEFREAERNIRKARDAAELANSAKSEFIANISHELRTPLQGIIGFSELGCDMANVLPEHLDLFTEIHASGQRMLTLVNGLLDVSQMDSAWGSLPLERIDLAQLVRAAVDGVRPKALARNLEVRLHKLAAPVACDGDSVRLQQAVRNVLANAVRYSPVGETIEVTLHDRGASGIELIVRDHGPGVPDAELELIFDAFVQSTRTRDGSGGTGLGLTIARKIVMAHGGHVVAANAEGGGALLSLWLPAASKLADSPATVNTDDLRFASEVT